MSFLQQEQLCNCHGGKKLPEQKKKKFSISLLNCVIKAEIYWQQKLVLAYYFTSTSGSMIHHDLHYKKTSFKYNKDHSYISMLTVQAHVCVCAHSRAWEWEREGERYVQLKELWQKVMSQLQNYFAPGDRDQQWRLSVKFRSIFLSLLESMLIKLAVILFHSLHGQDLIPSWFPFLLSFPSCHDFCFNKHKMCKKG